MFDSFIANSARRYGVPESWIRAVIEVESYPIGNPNSYRYEPALGEASYGLMQVLESTARGDLGFVGDVNGLFDPETNIDMGTKYLAQLRDRWGNDFRSVYSAYNSGNGNLWKTSSQVAANVAKAAAALARYAGAAVTDVAAAAGDDPGAVLALAAAAGLLIWKWRRG